MEYLVQAGPEKMECGEKGLVGVGTLLVLISFILVSVVAGGVILETTGLLSEGARSSGEGAGRETSTGFEITDVLAHTNENRVIDNLQLMLKIRPGSESLDVDNILIRLSTKQATFVSDEWITPGWNGVLSSEDRNYGTLALGSTLDEGYLIGSGERAKITVYPQVGMGDEYIMVVPKILEKNTRYLL